MKQDDGVNEKWLAQIASQVANYFGVLNSVTIRMFLYHIIQHASGRPSSNLIADRQLGHAEDFADLEIQNIEQAYDALTKAGLLEINSTAKSYPVDVVGNVDHEVDTYKLGPAGLVFSSQVE